MKPVFEQARASLKRVAYAEGEEESVLRAVQTVVDEGLARPILIGRASVIAMRIERLGLRIREGVDFDLTNIDDDPRFPEYRSEERRVGKEGVRTGKFRGSTDHNKKKNRRDT